MDYTVKKAGKLTLSGAAGHKVELSDAMLACDLSKVLADQYPGYQWLLCVNSEGKVIDIKNLEVSGTWGYRILRPDLMAHDELRHAVVIAGGEILERAGLRRGKIDQDVLPVWVEGITKLQDQPDFQRNMHKYRELLNAPTAVKH